MTKKTVITSEKREVWVIHHPSGKTTEHKSGSDEAEAAASLIRLLDHHDEYENAPEGTAADGNRQEVRIANAE